MSSIWDEALPFAQLADLVQQVDLRRHEAGNEALLRGIPESLLLRALEVCRVAGNESPDAYRFIMNVVRGQHWQEPKAGLWLVAVIDACRERASDIAWDAAVELHRLFEPALWKRIRKLSIDGERYKENPLAVLESCLYSPADGAADFLRGAFLHSTYRMIYSRHDSSRIAAIFAATRELYGFAAIQEFPAAGWCLNWCRTQTEFLTRFEGPERDMLIESIIVAAGATTDSGNDRLAQEILFLALQWSPPTGNSRAAAYKALGMNQQRLGELGAALRSLDAGTRVVDVDDEELAEELRLELSTFRALFENSPESIDISEHMFGEIPGAANVLQALKAILVRKGRGEPILDQESVEVFSALHAWTHREGETQVDSPRVRLNQILLLIKVLMATNDRQLGQISLAQLLVEAEALRSVATEEQLFQLKKIHQVLRIGGSRGMVGDQ